MPHPPPPTLLQFSLGRVMPPVSTAYTINTSCTGEFIWLNIKAGLLALFYFPIWYRHKWLINFKGTHKGLGLK